MQDYDLNMSDSIQREAEKAVYKIPVQGPKVFSNILSMNEHSPGIVIVRVRKS